MLADFLGKDLTSMIPDRQSETRAPTERLQGDDAIDPTLAFVRATVHGPATIAVTVVTSDGERGVVLDASAAERLGKGIIVRVAEALQLIAAN
jgi:hypothetical protein